MLNLTNKDIEAHYKRIEKPMPKELLEVEEQKKPPKYRAKHCKIDGILFDSIREGEYYQEIKYRLLAGEIAGYCLQPRFILVEGTDQDQAITYSADFIIFNSDGSYELIDIKGYESQDWKRKYKHFRLKYPKLNLKIIK